MYLSHEQFDQALASPPGEGARSLPGANAPGSGPEVAAARSPRAWAASLRLALETRISGWDIAPDLAEDIGSRRWFRGLGTLAGLGLAALALWPDFSPVEAATATPPDAAIRDQFRVHAIAPLRAGARTGIRMAPGDAVVPLAGVPERPSVRMVATLAAGDSFGRMLERAGEIGVRKSFGASSGQILMQFLFENVVITLLGGLIGLVLAWGLIHLINSSGALPTTTLAFSWRVFGFSFALALAFGLLSGLLPAWRMSKLQIVSGLRG